MPPKKAKLDLSVIRRSPRIPRQKEKVTVIVEDSEREQSPSEERNKTEIKKSINGREIDSYCWICHELGQEEICSICPRVYHTSCLGNKKKFEEGVCPECQIKSIDGCDLLFPLRCNKLQKLLSHATTQIYRSLQIPGCLWRWPIIEENDKLCRIIDGEILIDKLTASNSYTKVAAFFSEVKFIYHNCYILFGASSDEVHAARKLLKNFKSELMDIEACPECYENKISEISFLPDFFSRICKQPHTIIWAKLKGFPYWPAKSLKIVDDMADVRFFGTHDKAFVPVNNCYLMSHDYPTQKSPKQHKFLVAMKELNEYINRYNKEIGTFSFAEGKMAYKPENVDCELNENLSVHEEADNSSGFINRHMNVNAINLMGSENNISGSSGNDGMDDSLVLSSDDALSEDLLESSEDMSAFPKIGKDATNGFDDVSKIPLENSQETQFPSIQISAALTYPTITDVNSSLTYIPRNMDQQVEKAVHNHPYNPVSVCMTFSADEEVPRSNENNFHNHTGLFSDSSAGICTKSAPPQSDRKNSENISLLNPLPDNDMSSFEPRSEPMVTGSKSLVSVRDAMMEQTVTKFNYINNEPHNDISQTYGFNFSTFPQSRVVQTLPPMRSNWNGSEKCEIFEHNVNSVPKSSPICDNALINNIDMLENYPRSLTAPSDMGQNMPESSRQAEFSSEQVDCIIASNEVQGDPSDDVEFICEARGTISSTGKRNRQYPNSNRIDPTSARNLYQLLSSLDPRMKMFIQEQRQGVENFLAQGWILLNSFPDRGALLSRLYTQNQRLLKKIDDMEAAYKKLAALSDERSLNAARVIAGVHAKYSKARIDNCEEIYRVCEEKIKEAEMAMEKEFNKKVELYNKTVESVTNEKLLYEMKYKKLFKKTEILSRDQEAQTSLMQSDIIERSQLNAFVKEQINIERLKWEEVKNKEVIEAKRADWCNVCLKPAFIHCCWNTNYCNKYCQQRHLKKHAAVCQNKVIKEPASTSTATLDPIGIGHQDFAHCSNIQGSERSVTITNIHHTALMESREFLFTSNPLTIPPHPNSSFAQGRNSSPLLPTPNESTPRRRERNRR